MEPSLDLDSLQRAADALRVQQERAFGADLAFVAAPAAPAVPAAEMGRLAAWP